MMSTNRPSVAIIPARTGSKRVPNKNFRTLACGRTATEIVLANCLQSSTFDRIILSTDLIDSPLFGRFDRGIQIHKRSQKTSDDHATIKDVVAEVIKDMSLENAASIAVVYPTAFLVSSAILRQAHSDFRDNCVELVLGVKKFTHPIQRCFEVEGSRLKNCTWFGSSQAGQERTQDLAVYFHDAGAFAFGTVDFWLGPDSFLTLGKKTYCFDLSESFHTDIDDEHDWLVASNLYATFLAMDM